MIRRPPRSTLFSLPSLFLFFFNDTATTEIYTLSLHDALPISFDAVVAMALNRFGRDQVRVMSALTEIHESGVAVWTYQTGREVKLSNPTEILMASVEAFADAAYRHTIKVNTREALVEKARRGYFTGQATFGYDTVRVGDHSERVINPEQAAVVRRIFQWYADGRGTKQIALALNAESVPGPRGGKWSKESVSTMVGNSLYIGLLIYGRSRGVEAGGSTKKREATAPEGTTPMPALRIIDEGPWRRVQGAEPTYSPR